MTTRPVPHQITHSQLIEAVEALGLDPRTTLGIRMNGPRQFEVDVLRPGAEHTYPSPYDTYTIFIVKDPKEDQ